MIRKHFTGGYSLIELVIYLAIFITISVIIIHSLVTVMKTFATAQAYRRLQTNSELIMERITRETRDASNINVLGSTFNTNPGTLSLSVIDAMDVTHTVIFSVVNGKVQISDNGTTGDLSTSEVTVSSLVFRRITGGAQDAIKVELTLSTASGYLTSASFYSTVTLRGNP